MTILRKHISIILVSLGFILILISSIPLHIERLNKNSTEWIRGAAYNVANNFWGYWYFPDRKEVHLLRIFPEGLSILVNDETGKTAKGQFNLPGYKDSAGKPIKFISAMFCNAVDIDNDGVKEGIINANDSTSSYLISYTSKGVFSELYHENWPKPILNDIWDASFLVLGAGDFGNGIRLIISRITRFDKSCGRAVIVLDPINKTVEAQWEMGSVPMVNFGLLPIQDKHNNEFYITTNAVHNYTDYKGIPDTCAYLLDFKYKDGCWNMRKIYEANNVQMGKSVLAFPINDELQRRWIVSDSKNVFIVDDNGNVLSNKYEGYEGLCNLIGLLDENKDAIGDAVFISDKGKIVKARIKGSHLQVEKKFLNDEEYAIYGQKYHTACFYSDEKNVLFGLFSKGNLQFFNDNLEPLGKIKIDELGSNNFPSNTLHGRSNSYFICYDSIFQGKALAGRYDQLRIIDFKATPFKFYVMNYALPIFLIFGIGLIVYPVIVLLRLNKKHLSEKEKLYRTFDTAVKIFHRHPSDASLYLGLVFSDRWEIIQEDIRNKTEAVLNEIVKDIPHDTLREEVGLPKTGEERMKNLLTMRRVVLWHLAKGYRGFELLEKMHFKVDPKYQRLFLEAENILWRILEHPDFSHRHFNETDLISILIELQNRRLISVNNDPRRISGSIKESADGKKHGSFRLSQGGKEVELHFTGNDISIQYHSNLSPNFKTFLSEIGLSADNEPQKQNLFPEERLFVTSIN